MRQVIDKDLSALLHESDNDLPVYLYRAFLGPSDGFTSS